MQLFLEVVFAAFGIFLRLAQGGAFAGIKLLAVFFLGAAVFEIVFEIVLGFGRGAFGGGFVAQRELEDFMLAFLPLGVFEVRELEFDLIEAAFVAQQIPLINDELLEEFEGGFGIGLVGA